MTLSELSIRRPVLAVVMSLLVIVLGVAGLLRLPVRELPDVDRASVTITTTYTGAAPEIVDTQITEIIEGAVSGIDGIDSISSTSSLGRSRTVIEFVSGRNIDQAANDVRDAVGRVLRNLPDDAEQPQIVKADTDAEPIMRLSITSDRWGPEEITDFADRFIVDRLATLDGVAQVQINGQRRYAMRIWLDRREMAARGLTVDDVESALRRSNVELPAGRIQSATRELTVRTDTRLSTPEEFRELVVRRAQDYPIRLGEIATVEIGAEDRDTLVRANGHEAVGLGILRQPQANTIAVSNAVREQLAQLRPTLPPGMAIEVSSDDAVFISAAIHEVLLTLGIAIVLVVAVIFLFLGSLRATLVPAITIPVSVIGTFAVMYALGYSLNILTLLALILAIGLVVDDAIIVLENAHRRVALGEPPLLAADRGTREVTFAVLATSATLIAVFLPLSFMEGNVGRLFREFGVTMAAAVAISTLVALSTCASLSARLLKPHRHAPDRKPSRWSFDRFALAYGRVVERALNLPIVVLGIGVAVAGLAWTLWQALPKELTPVEDRAAFFISVNAPEGSTVPYTDAQVRQIEKVLDEARGKGEIARVIANVGMGSQSTRGFVVVTLTPWNERTRTQMAIVAELAPKLGRVSGARAVAINPQGLGLRGGSQPVQVVIGGPDFALVQEWTDALVERAEANPGLANVQIDYQPNRPQVDVVIDRKKAQDLGIEVEDVGRTLQTMFASRDITEFVDRGREYPVVVQAKDADRATPGDLGDVFVRARSGDLVPLAALLTSRERATVPDLRRFDRLPSITISASLTPGYDLGRAIAFFDGAAAEILPPEARLAYSGQSREFINTTGGALITFALALLVVYLVLAAQFESFVHPLTVMLTVPLAVTGALASLWFTGRALDVYGQIGLILLIGLTTKNGILIVEFANQRRAAGLSIREAVREAAVLRLRPILMTAIATILGAVPLILTGGAGGESRSAIGIVVVGGLTFASLLTLFVVPVLYEQLARFAKPTGMVASLLERMAAERRPAE
ncbi:MAG: efflux RND transporter permease subunit [Geminicoccaceae bacterium]